jgi:predicted DCC family thiol-disulfide oxidoreductase YuxK
MPSEIQKLTLFYDGACPLCRAEILFLSRQEHNGLLDFVDINSNDYDPKNVGVSCEQALASMYGQFADGTLIKGVAVFSQAYRRANLSFLAWLFSRKSLQPLLQFSYQVFAKNRHVISRALGPTALWIVRKTGSTTP